MKRITKQSHTIMGFSCSFTKIESLKLPTVTLNIGKVRAATYCEDTESDKKQPWVVQCNLPDFPTIVGRFKEEEIAKTVCLRIASIFIKRLNGE